MNSSTEGDAVSPRTVDEARDAVERSRQRISSTLDTLEDRIVEKKHELQDRADVLRPVRERIAQRPFMVVAVAVGVGALLGSLGHSSASRGDAPRGRRGRVGRTGGDILEDRDRAELRRWRRARRERLRARTHENGRHAGRDDDEAGSRLDGLKHQLMGAVTSAISAAVAARVRDFAASGLGGGDRGDSYRGGRR
jgi:ElaB/YqjD/DUF883 family membrane-anchored ribosome-binding protein